MASARGRATTGPDLNRNNVRLSPHVPDLAHRASWPASPPHIGVTWTRTYAFVRWARAARFSNPLVTLCLRDGVPYLPLLSLSPWLTRGARAGGELCVNRSSVHASTSTSTSSTSVDARDDWYTIVPIAPILVSRFLLHLRRVSERWCDSDSDADAVASARWSAGKDRSLPLEPGARSGDAGPADSVAFSSRLVGNMGAGWCSLRS
ncbi:uncharacterized protein B0H18DRAFT_1118476 [Fomitopsis serialis]|uniref:uncharacterized protein n=1 Tax=Fomitopsis serialis TaxID=139415 RepID=UPI002008BC0B|nr:uncharacterized protein B0H18DRAFT_1118476 [Neoantrodia serialis]KAH9927690.1 hypothetical protein B0H18DRAFT_1118476 [Neoantrodia serialis]